MFMDGLNLNSHVNSYLQHIMGVTVGRGVGKIWRRKTGSSKVYLVKARP